MSHDLIQMTVYDANRELSAVSQWWTQVMEMPLSAEVLSAQQVSPQPPLPQVIYLPQ